MSGNHDSDVQARVRRLNRFFLQSVARDLLPRERVSFCLRSRGFNPGTRMPYRDVWIMFAKKIMRAHYKHLFVCGSVWMCPICSAKISERRRVELTRALESSKFHLALVSLTVQHTEKDLLKDSLGALLRARDRLKSGRAWCEFCEQNQVVGSVSALEPTYGANGWHPHSHQILVARRPIDAGIVSDFYKPRWLDGLCDSGRSASWERGVDVRTKESDIADYITKFGHEPKPGWKAGWTIEHEVTKSVSKMARGSHGLTPLELLSMAGHRDRQAARLWCEYALTFKGRHQLQWSRGLRSILGLKKEETDKEVAERSEEDSVLLASLSPAQWKVILSKDARGEVLEVASSGCLEKLTVYLWSLGVESEGAHGEL